MGVRPAQKSLSHGRPAAATAPPPHLKRGRGIALSLRHGNKGESDTEAEATLSADGTVTISHNAADLGQGIYNMISLVAARTLGVPQEQVRVEQPYTGNMLAFAGASAQRTTVEMGNAVKAACVNLQRQILDLATETHGGQPAELVADVTRLRDEVGWRPSLTLDDGLASAVDYWRRRT